MSSVMLSKKLARKSGGNYSVLIKPRKNRLKNRPRRKKGDRL